jgi:hypothetical protein
MKYAMQIQLKLLNIGFHIERADDIEGGERFYLAVGAIVTVYDNGTVMVQGKLKPKYRTWALRTLRRVLPSGTRWHNK